MMMRRYSSWKAQLASEQDCLTSLVKRTTSGALGETSEVEKKESRWGAEVGTRCGRSLEYCCYRQLLLRRDVGDVGIPT